LLCGDLDGATKNGVSPFIMNVAQSELKMAAVVIYHDCDWGKTARLQHRTRLNVFLGTVI